MSLINQMLRDLETRKSSNNTPPTLQLNVQATQPLSSKRPLLLWSLLTVVIPGGIYSAYQYSKNPPQTPSVIVADIPKDPVPAASYEKVLSAPNAVTVPTPVIEPKPAENNENQSSAVAQLAHEAQPAPTAQSFPEITAGTTAKKTPVSTKLTPESTTAKQKADALYRQVESNSEDLSMNSKLEQALELDPRHLKARLLLAKKLHNQGLVSRTAELLDQGLALFPGNLQFVNARAQLFLQQKNPNNALKTLQSINLAGSTNETYLSLLAATYQQLQSFTDAAKVYQRLVAVNPEKAENWLGLALSQEKIGNPRLAIEAYQHALNKNTLKESITSYIRQRLTELR